MINTRQPQNSIRIIGAGLPELQQDHSGDPEKTGKDHRITDKLSGTLVIPPATSAPKMCTERTKQQGEENSGIPETTHTTTGSPERLPEIRIKDATHPHIQPEITGESDRRAILPPSGGF